MKDKIIIQGARVHNLKNISLNIPKDKLIVITGLSGSGKSSLAFDTLYAEGQRRYVESLSAYARQFLQLMEKPDVDSIEGLSPSISIDQKSTSHNPRSTVGTVTEIHDYLRLLYARVGDPMCPDHQITLTAQTVSQMVDRVLDLPTDTKIMILSPVIQNRKGEHLELFAELTKQGFLRVRIDKTIYEIDHDLPPLDRYQNHNIDIVIDRLKVKPDNKQRIAEAFETALRLANGKVILVNLENNEEELLSSRFSCPVCDYSLPELEPRLFSFNSPMGACPTCDGLGVLTKYIDEENSITQICPDCNGARLKKSSRFVFINGKSLNEINLLSLKECQTFFDELHFESKQKQQIAYKIILEISARLHFLNDVGLNYLNLGRSAETLSGGEAQRIRLASQIGSGLTGVMYVLDEPSIGLHQRDNDRLIATLKRLRDMGNTVIVVEHDEDMMNVADHLIDMGKGAGVHGGEVIAQGTPEEIKANIESVTGNFLSGREKIEMNQEIRPVDPDKIFRLFGASGNNLKHVNLELPVGLLVCVTGISGSGKSTLINETLYKAVHQALSKQPINIQPAPFDRIEGLEFFDKIINVDQSPIGRTPRSNPATYTGLFTPIRELFCQTHEARARGYSAGRFSFNVKGGRCEACEGDGVLKVEMHFMPDVYVPCEVCQGTRYNRETLEIYYKGKTIFEILQMTVEDAYHFFEAIPVVKRKLQTLRDVGLDYITLGQSATTLSGGEAQRVKLALELSKRDTGKTLYILDEPTTGLHFHDIRLLLKVLHQLKQKGNTIVVIEHNLDVIKTADWVIDLGPEGGSGGGQIIATGTPKEISKNPNSITGKYLTF